MIELTSMSTTSRPSSRNAAQTPWALVIANAAPPTAGPTSGQTASEPSAVRAARE
ncbi:MAG: hypothetical protein ACXV3S_03860 [Kineosporiaceae bacterium]